MLLRRLPVPPIVLSLMLAALLAGCGKKPSPARVTPPAEPPHCLAAIEAAGARTVAWQMSTSGACGVSSPVVASTARFAMKPPLKTSCLMLAAWMSFEPEVEALALRHLGQRVVALRHYGSHACRTMTGNGNRRSLHASARALDIAGFELADGSVVLVKRDWRSRGPEGRFLRAVAKAACQRFSVVLTPESDRFHHDHIHVDLGPWKLCST
ncbi:extensin family protein [Marinimicrococcus flavescens]|uniref:Extensin family protein n=1 Tax=Marinimicrococcus flavescens TaxID=3031815 RepID=A0AAP3XSZ6_9PROT|nr:extensin family protein [Marinimicrococcus flavescens]